MKTHQQIIDQGIIRFVLLKGVIGWGIPTAMVYQLIRFMIEDKPFLEGLISSLIIFAFMGFFWGLTLWKKLKAKELSK
jgi:hypothetical protein